MGEVNAKPITLVGTYRTSQKKWISKQGIYNYPVGVDDKFSDDSCGRVGELWLYSGLKSGRSVFSSEFLGKMSSGDFLRKYPDYPVGTGPRHGDCYLVFKVAPAYAPSLVDSFVHVRISDFSRRTPGVAKAAKTLLEKSGENKRSDFAALLPAEVSEVPEDRLCACEEAVQLDLFPLSVNRPAFPYSLSSTNIRHVGNARIELGDSFVLCEKWEPPTVIVSDGPYGLGSYPGDPPTPEGLSSFYEPFLKKWYDLSLPSTTLWFWNSEQGWANCHRIIENCGWEFRNCHIWDKGMSHVAGNCNTRTIRKYPVVTEVCAQYVRKNRLLSKERSLSIRDWLRAEWGRTGLPFRLTNVACGVKDAATRKYFAKDHLWYFPPAEAFVKIAHYANANGDELGRPYFAKGDGTPFLPEEWELMRAKFHCEVGVSNVWHLSAVRGPERIKKGTSCLHMNQKPLILLEQIIRSSSDEGDVVWEPFGGLCSASVAAIRLGRDACAAELNEEFLKSAKQRIDHEIYVEP